MKIRLPDIDYTFDCGMDRCCSVVIENQKVFYKTIEDISRQIDGIDGISVLSEDNKPLTFAKSAEMHSLFVPFDMNTKSLLTKINARLVQMALDDKYHMRTMDLLAQWERYMLDMSIDMVGNVELTKLSVDSLIKAAGVKVDDAYDNLGEQLLDYMELVHEYERAKLFILVNVRSYMSDDDMDKFLESVLDRRMQVLILESMCRDILHFEKRYIIDADLCIIC